MSSSLESTKPANNRALPRTAVQTHWKRPTRANRSASPSPLTRPNSQLVASMAQRSVYIYPSSSPPAPKKYIPDIVTPRGQRAKPHLSAVSSLLCFPSSLDFSLSILPANPLTKEAVPS
ncbi:hypothetical protein F5887DRAFT_1079476 [Amanita rubescens]|nr:hypothetical protein F5887DRAFT_1079476 [Amanita rubescens]